MSKNRLLNKCRCGRTDILYQVEGGEQICLKCLQKSQPVRSGVADGVPARLERATLSNFMTKFGEWVESGRLDHSDEIRAQDSLERAEEIAQHLRTGSQIGSVFYGENGLGKSHLAVGIMREVQHAGQSAMMVNAEFFYQACQEYARSGLSVEDLIYDYSVDLLVFDDCSFAADTEFFKRVVTMLVYHVMDTLNASIIITTNLRPNGLASLVGDAVIDRVSTFGLNQVFEGNSMRSVLNRKGEPLHG